jgi:hypothetical protein
MIELAGAKVVIWRRAAAKNRRKTNATPGKVQHARGVALGARVERHSARAEASSY